MANSAHVASKEFIDNIVGDAQGVGNAGRGESIGWDDELDATAGSAQLQEGPGRFSVKDMVRGRFDGSKKMSACPVAELTLEVTDATGARATVTDKLFLNRKTLFKITAFARSTGLISAEVKDGESFRMPWSEVVGTSGNCEIGHRKWTGDDGVTRTFTQIRRYL